MSSSIAQDMSMSRIDRVAISMGTGNRLSRCHAPILAQRAGEVVLNNPGGGVFEEAGCCALTRTIESQGIYVRPDQLPPTCEQTALTNPKASPDKSKVSSCSRF
ncbi:MAG TPA: hypothetical protein VFQ88_01100 [Nevskiaceae bacterium]|nr:hypothetical protein [Nevskiaceae bacterium]